MLDKLFAQCQSLTHFSRLISNLEDVTSMLSADYLKDKDMKNAAIDAIIEILQAHKDK